MITYLQTHPLSTIILSRLSKDDVINTVFLRGVRLLGCLVNLYNQDNNETLKCRTLARAETQRLLDVTLTDAAYNTTQQSQWSTSNDKMATPSMVPLPLLL